MTWGHALPQASTNIAPRHPDDRVRAASRRRLLLGAVLALSLAAAAFAAAPHPLNGQGPHAQPRPPPSHNGTLSDDRAYLSVVSWPQQGQAALVLGDGAPAASPDEQPVPIASLAKVMTAYLTLERYPLSGAQDGLHDHRHAGPGTGRGPGRRRRTSRTWRCRLASS